MKTTYTVTCRGCRYTADFDNPNGAITAADMHADLGKNHVLTTHQHSGSVPVIVAITNPEHKPRTQVFTTDVETY